MGVPIAEFLGAAARVATGVLLGKQQAALDIAQQQQWLAEQARQGQLFALEERRLADEEEQARQTGARQRWEDAARAAEPTLGDLRAAAAGLQARMSMLPQGDPRIAVGEARLKQIAARVREIQGALGAPPGAPAGLAGLLGPLPELPQPELGATADEVRQAATTGWQPPGAAPKPPAAPLAPLPGMTAAPGPVGAALGGLQAQWSPAPLPGPRTKAEQNAVAVAATARDFEGKPFPRPAPAAAARPTPVEVVGGVPVLPLDQRQDYDPVLGQVPHQPTKDEVREAQADLKAIRDLIARTGIFPDTVRQQMGRYDPLLAGLDLNSAQGMNRFRNYQAYLQPFLDRYSPAQARFTESQAEAGRRARETAARAAEAERHRRAQEADAARRERARAAEAERHAAQENRRLGMEERRTRVAEAHLGLEKQRIAAGKVPRDLVARMNPADRLLWKQYEEIRTAYNPQFFAWRYPKAARTKNILNERDLVEKYGLPRSTITPESAGGIGQDAVTEPDLQAAFAARQAAKRKSQPSPATKAAGPGSAPRDVPVLTPVTGKPTAGPPPGAGKPTAHDVAVAALRQRKSVEEVTAILGNAPGAREYVQGLARGAAPPGAAPRASANPVVEDVIGRQIGARVAPSASPRSLGPPVPPGMGAGIRFYGLANRPAAAQQAVVTLPWPPGTTEVGLHEFVAGGRKYSYRAVPDGLLVQPYRPDPQDSQWSFIPRPGSGGR